MKNPRKQKNSQMLIEIFKRFSGLPMISQARELLAHGWLGIGYLMFDLNHSSGGELLGRKRVAFNQASAAELDSWFAELVSNGFTPLFRYYLAHECALENSEFQGTIVHRAKHGAYEVLVEFIPGFVDFGPESAALSKIASDYLDAASVAPEFAMVVEMASHGATIMQTKIT